jgi:hypothetical protein
MPEILGNIILDCESVAGREPDKVQVRLIYGRVQN